MTPRHVELFRKIVTDQVAENVAREARAGHPQGLTDRSFEAITGDLVMANWERLAQMPVAQCVARICGTEQRTRRPHKGA